MTFIGKAFRRPDGERVARLAVEKLALLAAAAALNKVSPHHAELFARTRLAQNHGSMYGAVDLASGDIRGPAGPGAAVTSPHDAIAAHDDRKAS